MIGVTIQVGDREFEAALIDNASTQTLIAQMPERYPYIFNMGI